MTLHFPQPGTDGPLSRLDELLADRATVGLNDAEKGELRRLLDAAGAVGGAGVAGGQAMERDDLDLTATLLHEALAPGMFRVDAALPAHLLNELDHDAKAFCVGVSTARGSALRLHDREDRVLRGPRVVGKRFMREWSGWLAAAACLAFGVYAWTNRNEPAGKQTTVTAGTTFGMESLRERAIERINRWFGSASADVQRVPMGTATPDASPTSVSLGEVIWNRAEGNGVLVVKNLAPLAKGKAYQVWIIDQARGTKLPVTGGLVSEVSSAGEVMIPIDPSVRVSEATMFLISVEKDGGEVLATPDKVVGIAVPQAGEGMAPPPVFETK